MADTKLERRWHLGQKRESREVARQQPFVGRLRLQNMGVWMLTGVRNLTPHLKSTNVTPHFDKTVELVTALMMSISTALSPEPL